MKTTGWRDLMGRVLLVMGLVAGPWPSALFAAPAGPNEAGATQVASDESPCPQHASASTDSDPVSAHCPCCDDGGPCTPNQCASASAPGLPTRTVALLMHPDGADLQAALSTRPPEPRPGERLRPPIV